MAQMQKRSLSLLLNSVYPIVLIGANLTGSAATSFLDPLIHTEADLELLSQAFEGFQMTTLLSILVPTVLCIIYSLPISLSGSNAQVDQPSSLSRRRLLNAPLVLSLLSGTGWLMMILNFFVGAYINQVPLRLSAAMRFVLEWLLAGALVFVITYYLLEFISRKYFIPQFFPDGKLSACEGAIVLSIRVRFFIYFFAAAIFPISLLYGVIVAMEGKTDPRAVVFPVTVLTGVVVILGAFVTYLISKLYQTPLVEMKRATEKIREGDYDIKVGVVSNDELGHLGEAVNEMAVGLKERELIKAAHERLTQELAVAWRIQESFLPKGLPDVPGWQLTATLEPAKQTSGDFYDLIPLSGGRLGLLVADVTDKGVGAALYMALSRTLIRTYAVEYDTRPDLAFSAAHSRILADTNTSQFVTVFYGVLDPAAGTLTYSNAGHNPPYLLSACPEGANLNGADTPVSVQELINTGPPLGLRLLKDGAWEQKTVQFDPGDVLVLYSDGVTEAQDAQEELFEEERLLEVVRANIARSAQVIQDTLIAEVHEFVGDAPQFDDITLMVLVRGPMERRTHDLRVAAFEQRA